MLDRATPTNASPERAACGPQSCRLLALVFSVPHHTPACRLPATALWRPRPSRWPCQHACTRRCARMCYLDMPIYLSVHPALVRIASHSPNYPVPHRQCRAILSCRSDSHPAAGCGLRNHHEWGAQNKRAARVVESWKPQRECVIILVLRISKSRIYLLRILWARLDSELRAPALCVVRALETSMADRKMCTQWIRVQSGARTMRSGDVRASAARSGVLLRMTSPPPTRRTAGGGPRIANRARCREQ
ncbi:hypothetical protein C8R45DRAFT_1008070 [Mycena sanguinolenta]|nr:hypothetical protein C8R45DRAFT_1008070 [Mycena sanguinolenta]